MEKNNDILKNDLEKSIVKIKEEKFKGEIFTKIKKKWLKSRINTIALMLICGVIVFGINYGVKRADITPIDCTTSKSYTITEETKTRISKIDKDINIYFFNFNEAENSYELTKQYEKTNSKIKVEFVDSNKNIELTKKYEIADGVATIVVESGQKSKTITEGELINYDYSSGKTVDLTEQKITSAIMNVISEKIPKAYFLSGYTDFTLTYNYNYPLSSLENLTTFLNNEVLSYETLDILNKQGVPSDCDLLIIMTPIKDFDDFATEEIIKYINKGGNILWFNGAKVNDEEFTNVDKILGLYGVKGFEKGLIYETDMSKLIGYDSGCFTPEVLDSTVLKDVKLGAGTVLFYASKINIDTERLEEINVQRNDLLQSSEKSYFTSDLTGSINIDNDTAGPFIVGAEFTKTFEEENIDVENEDSENEDSENEDNENENSENEVEETEKETIISKMIIYGNDLFISDGPIPIDQTRSIPVLGLYNNLDVALNSIAYLTENYEDITIRKNYDDSVTDFMPTQQQKNVIMGIIFSVPILIIVFGLMIWIRRKRRQ